MTYRITGTLICLILGMAAVISLLIDMNRKLTYNSATAVDTVLVVDTIYLKEGSEQWRCKQYSRY